ncbi:MAG: hypothetical protein CM15mP111_4470 [Hyphomicrobiales bacterium]|nr:MAG: hypothetical protein CM15mP111_4470 [Hyphomicrobiales bacterium]
MRQGKNGLSAAKPKNLGWLLDGWDGAQTGITSAFPKLPKILRKSFFFF